jgi:uncharacterized protein YndB with AHSA1/START domain
MAKQEKLLPFGRGKLEFTVAHTYKASLAKVWEAITEAKHVQKYFVEKVTGDFRPDLEPVIWHWKKWGSFTQWPIIYDEEKELEFAWQDHKKKYLTVVNVSLKKKGKTVELRIRESGWKQADIKNAFSNCEGWTMYLCFLENYLNKKR